MTHANGNGADEPIIIKKYANRRLYDTSTSAYVTLEHLSTLVRDGKEFIVQDAKTGVDLTRTVLAQIIFEQENRKDGVLPVSFLRQLIQFYGDSFQSMLPAYLELSMQNFTSQQEKWREYMSTAMGDENKARAFDDQVRKNMEMFEETMRLFTPFVPKPPRAEEAAPAAKPEPSPAAGGEDTIRALQKQMAEMQKQLASLATPPAPPKDKS
ncbi:MAG: polyhydroxyalkanoate synthesis repressor PhaR [Alphaproteobacteria bacterium]|nr:polyhydroxyalkanoate synthesis repressor PhaR [Alphaproteobacteria bacterium]